MTAKKTTAKAAETITEREAPRRDDPRTSSFKARTGDRVSMGGYTQQLAVTGIPDGYVGRWVNHDGERIQQALNAGYIPLYKDGTHGDIDVSGGDLAHEDEWISKSVGETQFGKLIAYLMIIRKEWHKEGQARKQADIDLFDQAIQQGNSFDPQGNLVSDGTTYSESSIKHNADPLRR
jgi:hypothetical protein